MCWSQAYKREREGHVSEWPSVTKLTNDGGRGEFCQILNVAYFIIPPTSGSCLFYLGYFYYSFTNITPQG